MAFVSNAEFFQRQRNLTPTLWRKIIDNWRKNNPDKVKQYNRTSYLRRKARKK